MDFLNLWSNYSILGASGDFKKWERNLKKEDLWYGEFDEVFKKKRFIGFQRSFTFPFFTRIFLTQTDQSHMEKFRESAMDKEDTYIPFGNNN